MLTLATLLFYSTKFNLKFEVLLVFYLAFNSLV